VRIREPRRLRLAEAIDYAFHGAADDALPPTPDDGRPWWSQPAVRALRGAAPLAAAQPGRGGALQPARGADAVRLFEVGHVFWRAADGGRRRAGELALVAGGRLGRPWERQVELDLFDLKGVVESLAEELGSTIEARPADDLRPGSPPERRPRSTSTAEEHRSPRPVDETDETSTPSTPPSSSTSAPAAPGRRPAGDGPVAIPGHRRDLTLLHPVSVPWAEIAAAIDQDRPADLAHFGLEVRYTGEGVPDGAVATTIGFVYAAGDRSLTQEEVNQRHRELAARLVERFGWASQQP
jgi:phenylalanyl-tRNA synthetase beta chain